MADPTQNIMTTANLTQASAAGALKINAFGDRYLYNISRGSFDRVSAQAIFDAEFSKLLFREDVLNIIIGTDSGLLPKYVQQRGIPVGSRFIFIEPDPILDQLHQNQLLDDLPPEIVCTTASQWEEYANVFKIKEYAYISGIKLFDAICAQQVVLDDYAELSWQLRESINILNFRYFTAIGCESFIVRQLENIAENILPITLLADAYQGKTVIILAGGPSLTTVFPWLLDNRHKLVVFSVSRISRQLVAAGIEPDFVFSVDPQEENIDVSREMFLFSNKTIFINGYHVQPALLNQWHGQSLYMGTRLPWQSGFNIDNIGCIGPTVTNSALSIAHYLGFSKILLAGFDVCYTKDGITHAKGSDEQLAGPKYDLIPLQVETYSGEFRPTSYGFSILLSTLEQQAKIITADHREIINLAPYAAKVAHIAHIPPAEINLPDIQEDITSTVQRILQLTSTELNKHYQAVIDELEKADFQMKAIAKLAKKALNINQRMYNAEGKIENYKEKRELDNIEKLLKRKYRHHSKLVKKIGIRHFIKITSPHDSNDYDAEKAKKLGNIYYQAYQSGAAALSTLINAAITRTKTRQEELKETPNIGFLLEQWKQDKSYRRAAIWLKKHPTAHYSAQTASALQAMQEQFNQIMLNQDTAFKANTAKHSTLPILKSKINLLFKHKKIDDLKNLKTGFINDPNHENKEPYLLLIDAYLAELENDVENALAHYNSVINLDRSPLLEEALLRIASISLEQHNQQNALLAMDCLSQISPTYLPYKAELARILGDFILAIDSYNAYINFFPEDILNKLKLTALYIDIKVYEAAELMLEHLLQIVPNLEAAIALKNRLAQIKREQLKPAVTN
ncbi:MAG: 6-hydroxymethylpterin diphosphokinase MptE-like protein [Methylobacter sp.]